MTKKPRLSTKRNKPALRGFNGERRGVDDLATWARRFIAIISGSILVLFAWLQIKDVPVVNAIQKVSPELLIKTSLIIYFTGWVGGTNFDTSYSKRRT